MTAATPTNYYVYLHKRKTDLEIFYIGKGIGRRAWAKSGRNSWWKRIVEKHDYNVEIYQDNLSNEEALKLECKLTLELKGNSKLVNMVLGGGGITGWKHSDEAKEKISKFNKGKKMPEAERQAFIKRITGKKLSEEHKKNMSLAKKGKARPKLSEETKSKISKAHIGMKSSPETIEKLRQSKLGKYVGKDNPTYDHTVRYFIHENGEEFVGTRGEFILKFNANASCVSELINKKRTTVKKWRIKW